MIVERVFKLFVCKYISSDPTSIYSKLELITTASIVVHTPNFFEQILAGWDPRYKLISVPGDCVFYFKNMCMCLAYIKEAMDSCFNGTLR